MGWGGYRERSTSRELNSGHPLRNGAICEHATLKTIGPTKILDFETVFNSLCFQTPSSRVNEQPKCIIHFQFLVENGVV